MTFLHRRFADPHQIAALHSGSRQPMKIEQDGKRKSGRSHARTEQPYDTAIAAVCAVTARKKGVVEKTHAWRYRGISVRFFLNNFMPGRHNR
jgi:hypothetical protein